jgi:hypothetical protein
MICYRVSFTFFNNKQFLTPEDGRLRPKHVVYLKDFYKVTSVKTLLSVLNIDKLHKDGSESEIYLFYCNN